MQQGSVVADFIDAFHVVRGQNDGGALRFKRLDFIHDELYVKWIKARKWFVENEHLRLVHERSYELYFLSHAFGSVAMRLLRQSWMSKCCIQ